MPTRWWVASVLISLGVLLGSAIFCDPAAAEDCPSPYWNRTSDGRCTWSCGEGTQPNYDTRTCTCRPGHVQTGTDRFGRRVCVALACIGPYHAWTPDGRCEWSCGEGTHPHLSGECVCDGGLAELGTDSRGRRICGTRECPSPYQGLSRDGRCVFTCARGTQPDPASGECICRPGLDEVATDDRGRRICDEPCLGPYWNRTSDGRCTWSCGEGTQPNYDTRTCTCRPGHVQTGTDRFGRRVCVALACIGPYHAWTPDGRCEWSCGEGTHPHLIRRMRLRWWPCGARDRQPWQADLRYARMPQSLSGFV